MSLSCEAASSTFPNTSRVKTRTIYLKITQCPLFPPVTSFGFFKDLNCIQMIFWENDPKFC